MENGTAGPTPRRTGQRRGGADGGSDGVEPGRRGAGEDQSTGAQHLRAAISTELCWPTKAVAMPSTSTPRLGAGERERHERKERAGER
jgi:hypothetical protein